MAVYDNCQSDKVQSEFFVQNMIKISLIQNYLLASVMLSISTFKLSQNFMLEFYRPVRSRCSSCRVYE